MPAFVPEHLGISQIPIQLAEMSPPAFRATFPGVSYQLGNVRMIHVHGIASD